MWAAATAAYQVEGAWNEDGERLGRFSFIVVTVNGVGG